MACYPSHSKPLVALLLVTLLCPVKFSSALTPDYYKKSCPNVLQVLRPVLAAAIAKEKRIGASIVRLFFHDCFVNGCDASLLLDDKDGIVGEKKALPNVNSVRGFKVVDAIKTAVEKACPGVVSCADVLAIAASESVAILGGPHINTKLGRRDARTANQTDANVKLPPPTFDLRNLTRSFKVVGLREKDVVALSGAHTIGLARCTTFRDHIYNGTNIDPSFAALRQSTCPRPNGTGDNNLAPLDLQTPTAFDNDYFKNLVHHKGLLNSDQVLFNGGSADALVLKYSRDIAAFFKDFVESMIRMGDIRPARGTPLEVRKNCRRVNK